MYKVLIIEDEAPAVNRLKEMLAKTSREIEVVEVKDGIQSSVEYLRTSPSVDLIFMDIQLSDGLSFNIFSKVEIDIPIIFTTAYSQYAFKAFKVSSIDYLLKPIEQEDLNNAILKLEKFTSQNISPQVIKTIETALNGHNYKQRFLIKNGGRLSFVKTDQINYFFSDSGLTFVQSGPNKKHILEETLDQLESSLDPGLFFRINRKFILNINAIEEIQTYYNNRLILQLNPAFSEQVIVSRQRVVNFKQWLDS
ncbi:LytR/AlgR family response regulator transcription factor [Portibacter lacus]|uniref:DNA-binding response regulator n=1 Tax=Portibacter lacus TaxID=1099794 RepID=A0AA37WGL8_9BACT|nr:LytTR family DNA-binding domain-containing protein [Portibacter lacus]GLR20023.1 DNA-binding response regulator [Portibacter lacus]